MTNQDKMIFLAANIKKTEHPMQLLTDMETIETMLHIQKNQAMINQFSPGVRKRAKSYRETLESCLEQNLFNSKQ